MAQLILPDQYTPEIDYMESQRAIKKIKDFFQQELAYGLKLRRVSAPLFVAPETGLNDNLNGVERTVSFTVKDMGEKDLRYIAKDLGRAMFGKEYVIRLTDKEKILVAQKMWASRYTYSISALGRATHLDKNILETILLPQK